MESIVADEELETMVRESRSSVAADLEAMQRQIETVHRRIDGFSNEIRNRISTSETAILNEIRDLSGRPDRRFERLVVRMHEIEQAASPE